MGGGLLNLIAYGNKNIILNGNPSKSFFKTSYAKYTNFGLQKFRIDFQGQKVLRENTNSSYEFVVPLYGDFLMDTYFVINMPHIWSPIYCPNVNSTSPNVDIDGECCQPYEFKWIENLGSQLIKMIRFTIGGKIIQEFSVGGFYRNQPVGKREEGKTVRKWIEPFKKCVQNEPANSINFTNKVYKVS